MSEPRSLASKLVSGTAVNAAGAIAGKPLDIVIVAITVHRIGAAAFGVIVIAQGLSQWPALAEKGVGQTLVRLVAQPDRDRHTRSMVSAAIAFYVLLGALTVAVGIPLSHLVFDRAFELPRGIDRESVAALDLLVVAAGIRLVTGYVQRVLVGEAAFVRLRSIELLRSIVALVATVAFVGNEPSSVTAAAFALLAGDAAAAVVGVVVARPRRFGFELASLDRTSITEHWYSARPVLIASGIGLGWTRVDPVIVGWGLGPSPAATYGIAARAYEALQSWIELLITGLLPATTTLLARGEATRVARVLRRALTYAVPLTWPPAIVAALFAPEIVDLWVGRHLPWEWSAMVAAMTLVIVATLPSALMFVVVGADRVAATLRVQALAAVVNVVIGVALVRTIGVSAVFIGTTVGTAIVLTKNLTIVADVTRSRIPELLAGLARPVASVAALAVALAAVRIVDPPLAVGAGVVAALGVAYAVVVGLTVFPREDLRHLLPSTMSRKSTSTEARGDSS